MNAHNAALGKSPNRDHLTPQVLPVISNTRIEATSDYARELSRLIHKKGN